MTFTPAPKTSPAPATRFEFRRFAVALAVAFAATAAGLLVSAGPTYAWDASSFSSSSEQQLVTLTNQSRAAAGLKALKVDSTLTSIARWRSKDMIVRDYFSHNIPPSGKKVFSILDAKGYCYAVAGENIGWNDYPDGVATKTIHRMFMDSSGPPLEHPRQALGRHRHRRLQGPERQEDVDGPLRRQVRLVRRGPTPKPKPKPGAKPKPSSASPGRPRGDPKADPEADARADAGADDAARADRSDRARLRPDSPDDPGDGAGGGTAPL